MIGGAVLAALATGCSADVVEELATVDQAVTCQTMTGTYPVKAALAVAMARELGEIDALKDLTVVNGVVTLSATAQAACANTVLACHNTIALLAMQDDSLRNYIDQNVFNPTSFRQDLIASFDRQRNHENDLRLNAPQLLPEAERLEFTGTVMQQNACGTHYEFDAFKAGCTGSSCALTHPENEIHRLVFFGVNPDGTGNPFIAFYSYDGGLAIDPIATLNGDTDAAPGTCEAGYAKFEPSHVSVNECCTYGGINGTWRVAPWSDLQLYCAR